MTKSERGNGSTLHATSREWSLDMLGNWDETSTWGGSSFNVTETRTHNDANELTSRTPSGSGALAMAYDKAGNLVSQATSGDPVTYIYDAWSRLVEVQYDEVARAQYQYNGLNWRVVKRADTFPHDGVLNQQRVMYYNVTNSGGWQLIEEFINDDWDDEAADDDHDRRMQYIWGIRYIDDIVLRRQFEAEDIMGPGTITDTWYHCTDTLFSTVAILDQTAKLIERVSYDTYGNARHHYLGDLNGDGAVNSADSSILTSEKWGDYGVGDLNRDGIVNVSDLLLLGSHSALPAGQLSAGSGGTDNIIGYAGYVFNAEVHTSGGGGGLYTVRHRVYSPGLGRWLTRDPIGYVDGMGLYEYVKGRATILLDSLGLNSVPGFCDPRDGCNPPSRQPPSFDVPNLNPSIFGDEDDSIREKIIEDLSPARLVEWFTKCEQIKDLIENIKNKIEEREQDLKLNPCNLPERRWWDHVNPKLSREGHRRLIQWDRHRLEIYQSYYNEWCRGRSRPAPTWKRIYHPKTKPWDHFAPEPTRKPWKEKPWWHLSIPEPQWIRDLNDAIDNHPVPILPSLPLPGRIPITR